MSVSDSSKYKNLSQSINTSPADPFLQQQQPLLRMKSRPVTLPERQSSADLPIILPGSTAHSPQSNAIASEHCLSYGPLRTLLCATVAGLYIITSRKVLEYREFYLSFIYPLLSTRYWPVVDL